MVVWLCTALILAAISFHFFITVTYPYLTTDPYQVTSQANTTVDEVEPPSPICYVLPAYDWFFVHVWYWIDFSLLAFVPFIVVLTGNCVMVTCVVRAVRFRYRQESHSVNSPACRSSGGATAGDKGKALTSSTVMLMTLSIAFLLTTSPNVIYFLKIDDWVTESNDDAHSVARLHLGFVLTNLLYYTNNATNFFLYCLAGSRFRRALCQMLRCCPMQRNRSEGAAGAEQMRRGRVKACDRQRRTTDAPLDGTNSTVPAAGAGWITLSSNVTIHPSV